jgi:HTH-type transcriptional regulator, cell division transcriptional repressor
VPDTATIYSEIPDNDTMGGRLLRARDAAGLTIQELATRIGVKPSTVQAWENDRSQPRANRLQMIAGMLGVSLSWLLHGVGTGPSEDEQLDRLKRLQDESQRLAARIEQDIRRFASQPQA